MRDKVMLLLNYYLLSLQRYHTCIFVMINDEWNTIKIRVNYWIIIINVVLILYKRQII